MPDIWKHLKRHKHQDSEDGTSAITDGLNALHISGSKPPSEGKDGRDKHKLAHGIAALTIGSARPPAPISQSVSEQPWVGGFQPQLPPGNHYKQDNLPPSSISLPSPSAYPPASPVVPVAMPYPIHHGAPLSLTMQYAALPIDLGTHHQQPISSSPPPAPITRPHSDPPPSANVEPISLPMPTGFSTPQRPKPTPASRPPQSEPQKLTKANLNALGSTTPTKVRRTVSSPSSPGSASGSAVGGSLQCSGRTKADKRCRNMVRTQSPLATLDPDVDPEIERFCHIHTAEVTSVEGVYISGKHVEFSKYIPEYLQPATNAALRRAMTQKPSPSDKPGFIYTFEIRVPSDERRVQLKVGRAVKLNKRIDEWSKQCGSKTQVLRGWWPGIQGDNVNLMKGTVDPGLPGSLHHRLERLVHLELADLAVNSPYLENGWPSLKSAPTSRPPVARVACSDCGAVHKEIFVFERMKGRNKGKEYELLVKPVIEKWGEYLREYIHVEEVTE